MFTPRGVTVCVAGVAMWFVARLIGSAGLEVVGIERGGRQVKQRVDLGHRAVHAPARAHLAPVQDELLHERTERHCSCPFSSYRNYSNSESLSSLFWRPLEFLWRGGDLRAEPLAWGVGA